MIIKITLNFVLDSMQEKNTNLKAEIKKAKRILQGIGWTEDEIQHYELCHSALIDYKIICDRNLVDLILLAYTSLVNQERLMRDNNIVKLIISKAISETVDQKVKVYLDNYNEEYFGYYTKKYFPAFPVNVTRYGSTGGIFQFFSDVYHTFYMNTIPSIMAKEVSDLLFNYLDLLDPLLGNLDYSINEMKKNIKEIKQLLNEDLKIKANERAQYSIRLKTMDLFVNIYQQYCDKKNYKILYLP